MCNECGCETEGLKCWKEIRISEDKKEWKKVKIHALRRCKNNECRTTWDRDVNASRNIHEILMTEHTGKNRPSYLCRPPKKVIISEKTVAKGQLSKEIIETVMVPKEILPIVKKKPKIVSKKPGGASLTET